MGANRVFMASKVRNIRGHSHGMCFLHSNRKGGKKRDNAFEEVLPPLPPWRKRLISINITTHHLLL